MGSVAVVIPYGGTEPFRRRAVGHVLEFYRWEFPDWPVKIGLDRGARFSRARAVNHGASSTMSDMVIVNDADTLVPPAQVREAVRLAEEAPGMVRAYTRYRRLSQDATERVTTYKDALAASDADVAWQQDPAFAHGCAVMRRECFEQVGGYDPRFEGWGYEDMAAELLFDSFWPDRRVAGDLFHLWHPSVEDPDDETQRANERRYYEKYEPHRRNPEALFAARFADE